MLRELKDEPEGIREARLTAKDLAELVRLKATGKISSTQQKKMFGRMWKDGTPLETLRKEEGEQVSDPAILEPIINALAEKNPKEIEKYQNGQHKVLGFFVGQVMKATRGKANPQVVQALVKKRLTPPS